MVKDDTEVLKLKGIGERIDEVGVRLMEYSLKDNLGIKELIPIYRTLLKIRNEFLEISFNHIDISELEQVRFSLVENLLNIKILIQECVGQDTKNAIRKLKELYKIDD